MKKVFFAAILIVLVIISSLNCFAGASEINKEAVLSRKLELEKSIDLGDVLNVNLTVYTYDPSNPPSEVSETAPVEERFIADFAKSLEARWQLSDNTPSGMTDDQKKAIYTRFVQTELSILEKYEDVSFSDPFMDLLAKGYIRGLKNQDYAIKELFTKDETKYEEYWTTKGLNPRKLVIFFMTQYYKTSVSSKYEDTLKDSIFSGYLLALADPVSDLINLINESEKATGSAETSIATGELAETNGNDNGANTVTSGTTPEPTPEPTPVPIAETSAEPTLEPVEDRTELNPDENTQVAPSPETIVEPTPESTSENMPEAKPMHFEIGQIIEFGSYEQDNNPGNGKEPIKWRVLATEEDRTLVVSDIALDTMAYEEDVESWENPDLSWETASVRKWLNDDFFNEAFSEEEKDQILVVNLETNDKAGDHHTEDHVFLLSIDEVKKYFQSNQDMACRGSEYGLAKCDGATLEENGYVFWWLRDMIKVYHPSESMKFGSLTLSEAATVIADTGVIDGTGEVSFGIVGAYNNFMVRPAMWVQIIETATNKAEQSEQESKEKLAAEVTEKPTEEPEPEPKPLILDISEIELASGTTQKLTPVLEDETITKVKYKWETSDKKVATVSNGTVRAVGEGTATITCSTTIDDKTVEASCIVNVYIGIKNITAKKKNLTIPVGSTEIIDVKISPNNATYQDLTWSSSNPNVATVDNKGKVSGVYGGECTITGTANEDNGKTVTVSVFVPSMSCSIKEVNLVVGRITTITINLYTKNKNAIKYDDNGSSNLCTQTLENDKLIFKMVPWYAGQSTLTVTDPNSPKSTIKIKITTTADNGLTKAFRRIKNDNDYREWMRGNCYDDYILVDGCIRQVEYNGNEVFMLIATKGKYDNYAYTKFEIPAGSKLPRLIEGDRIGILGKAKGVFNYKTVMNTTNSVPQIETMMIAHINDRWHAISGYFFEAFGTE